MTAVQAHAVGDLVEWEITNRGRARGMVLERRTEAYAAHIDELMHRQPGEGWQRWGAELLVRCTDPDCCCQPTSPFQNGTWLHSINESQCHPATDDIEVPLW